MKNLTMKRIFDSDVIFCREFLLKSIEDKAIDQIKSWIINNIIQKKIAPEKIKAFLEADSLLLQEFIMNNQINELKILISFFTETKNIELGKFELNLLIDLIKSIRQKSSQTIQHIEEVFSYFKILNDDSINNQIDKVCVFLGEIDENLFDKDSS